MRAIVKVVVVVVVVEFVYDVKRSIVFYVQDERLERFSVSLVGECRLK